jgi:hypothetical protein
VVGDQFVGPAFGEVVGDGAQVGERRQGELVVLDVLVEGQQFGLGRRVVGLEEGEVEVVLVDRDVENQANAAHSN